MLEVVIYIDQSQITNKSLYVDDTISTDKITEIVNELFGEKGWYSYDLINVNEYLEMGILTKEDIIKLEKFKIKNV